MADSDSIQDAVDQAVGAGLFDGWAIYSDDPSGTWTEYSPRAATGQKLIASPSVGFKIHVSSNVSSAGEVLTRIMPILARWEVPFKHTASIKQLAILSSGAGGPTQIGKFVTAYPSASCSAGDLAWEMHNATYDLEGPEIRTDVPVAENSLVHFRYGAFTEQWLQLPNGRITRARPGEAGLLEPDDRAAPTSVPRGVRAPFDSDSWLPSDRARIVGGRYVLVQRLHMSPRGSTWLGFSLSGAEEQLLIIKEARAHVMEAADGSDARWHLRYEADVLHQLAGTGVTPTIVDYWEESRRAYLVYLLVVGPTFAEVITELSVEGTPPPISVLRDWANQLCDTVATVHRAGFVVGDIKTANLIVTGSCFELIDLELAMPPTHRPIAGAGTAGYASPQQLDPKCGRSYADDIYAIGATLLAAALLTDASALPDSLAVAQFERDRDPQNAFFVAIARCLDPDPSVRFDSVEQIRAAIGDRRAKGRTTSLSRVIQPPDYVQLARVIGDDLVTSAIRTGSYVHWISEHPIQQRQAGRDLYAGSSGPALFLCTLHEATSDQRYLADALGCGQWLWETTANYVRQTPMAGLYFGDCGPGLLYLKLYLLTGDDVWAARALDVGRGVSAMPGHSPELLTGEAGTGLYLLAVWRATANQEMLANAGIIVNRLVSSREEPGFLWTIPPGHEGLSGQAYLGLSHGSAGIGYLFAEYAAASNDAPTRQECADLARWLLSLAQPCLSSGRGLAWPTTPENGTSQMAYWCHGAAGIARFFLRAHDVTGQAWILEAATKAGHAVAERSAWSGTTQCHGLAGNAELMIDIWQSTRDPHWLLQAQELGENLIAYRGERGWPTEYRDTWAPDLLVGQAGVGAAFLRLAAPSSPHLVTTTAFAKDVFPWNTNDHNNRASDRDGSKAHA
jgi:serine/threonine protein kinase